MKVEDRGSKIEDRDLRSSIFYLRSSIFDSQGRAYANTLARPTVWRANIAQESWVHLDHYSYAQFGYRGEYGGLQPGGCLYLEFAPSERPAATRSCAGDAVKRKNYRKLFLFHIRAVS